MATAANVSPAKGPEPVDDTHLRSGKFWSVKRVILSATLLIVAVAGLSYWLFARQFEATDDAQVDGHFAQLSPRVSGTVVYVNPLVENDRYVTAGTALLRLDPRDYQADLDHARAILDTKQAEADAASLQVSITNATAFSHLHAVEAEEKAAVEAVAEAQAALEAAHTRVQQ